MGVEIGADWSVIQGEGDDELAELAGEDDDVREASRLLAMSGYSETEIAGRGRASRTEIRDRRPVRGRFIDLPFPTVSLAGVIGATVDAVARPQETFRPQRLTIDPDGRHRRRPHHHRPQGAVCGRHRRDGGLDLRSDGTRRAAALRYGADLDGRRGPPGEPYRRRRRRRSKSGSAVRPSISSDGRACGPCFSRRRFLRRRRSMPKASASCDRSWRTSCARTCSI